MSSVLDRSLVALVVALAVVVTGIMAIAPPPSDRSKPWIVRTLLFPGRALMVQPRPSGTGTAPATPPAAAPPVLPASSTASQPATGAPTSSTSPATSGVSPAASGAGGGAAGSAAQLPPQSPAGTTSVTSAPPAADGRPKGGPLVLVSPPTPVNSQGAAGPDAAKSATTGSEATTSEGAPVAPATVQATPHASGQSSRRPGTARSTAPSSARYTVQVGALRDRANVDLLVAQLRQHGFEPVVTQDRVYRVRVGEDLDRAAADTLAATLRAAGFDTFVRTY